jgi:cytochrome c-type biogenesis protein
VEQNLNIIIAFAAGIISFISPCILPVIPSYLSFIGGVSYGELVGGKISKWGILVKSLIFVAGFSLVFTVLGVVFSSVGFALSGASKIINMAAGSIVIVLGLNYIFNFIKILNIEKKMKLSKRPSGAIGPMILGMAFAAGWTPCIGPILASILFLAGTSGQGLQGAVLLAFYSAGLGIPFILAGLFFSTYQSRMKELSRHLFKIKIASGILLVAIGVLIFFGSLARLNAFFFAMAGNLEAWAGGNPAGPRIVFFSIFLFFSIVLAFFYIRRVRKVKVKPGINKKISLYPARLILIAILFGVSILTLSGVLDFQKLIVDWLTFQGI